VAGGPFEAVSAAVRPPAAQVRRSSVVATVEAATAAASATVARVVSAPSVAGATAAAVASPAAAGASRAGAEAGEASDFLAGQLYKFASAWEAWGAPEQLVTFVKGHRLRLVSKPPLLLPHQFASHAVSPSPKVLRNVNLLRRMRAVVPVAHSPSFLSDLFVVTQEGKERPIFNCAALNVHLSPPPFHLPNIRTFQSMLQPGYWMYTIDIQKAFLNCRLHPSSRRFLRFYLQGQLFEWHSLVFGLSTIPHDFQALTSWIAQKMRHEGLNLLVYFDDFGGAAPTEAVAEEHAVRLCRRLESLGFPVSPKSTSKPVQRMKLLGMIFDTVANSLSLPPVKQQKISSTLSQLLDRQWWTLKQCQKLCGSLNFAALAIPLGTLHSRLIQRQMRQFRRQQPGLQIIIPPAVIAEMQWWQANLHHSLPLFRPPATVFVATDASDEGYGATVNGVQLSGLWTARKKRWHINRRELWVILRILQHDAASWAGQSILLQSDNTATVASINRQGTTKSLLLLETAMDILTLAEDHQIHLAAFYLPGNLGWPCRCASS
jgi:Reverse transcriptase (RNA-dependent DNA polymerase)